MTLHYPDELVNRLHLLWGAGFLSPGGADEVRSIVRGLDLAGRRVADIGCGTGGPAIILARETGARMVCLDVEPQLLDRARVFAAHSGVADRIEFHLVTPGPLPFPDAGFDVVFSKDALIHMPDKPALYREVMRVLKRGGAFAASDWLCGEGADDDPVFQDYLRVMDMGFVMATAAQTVAAMRAAGFRGVRTLDRNAWYAKQSQTEVKAIEGPLRDQAQAILGPEKYDEWLGIRRMMAAAAKSGSLRPTHLRGTRPA